MPCDTLSDHYNTDCVYQVQSCLDLSHGECKDCGWSVRMADVDIQDEIQLGDDDEAKAVAVNFKAYEKCRSQTARLALIRLKRRPPRKFGRLFSSKLSRPLSFCLFSVPLWSSTRSTGSHLYDFFSRRLDDGLLSGTSLFIKPSWNSCSRLGSMRWAAPLTATARMRRMPGLLARRASAWIHYGFRREF